VGKRFRMADRNMELTIVGVVRDVPPLRPDQAVAPEVYWSNRQLPRRYTYVLARTALPPSTLFDAVRRRVTAIDAELAPASMRPYSELVQSQLKRPRFTMLLIIAFGAAALLLAAVGVYGLLSYIVSTRQREIGIRLALGAGRGEVLGAHLAWGLRVAGLGVAVGLVAAVGMARGIESQIAGVSARDPATLAISAAFMLLVAVVACVVPAYRASRVDPASVLMAD
jgi:putative ABC transport system permease protein